MRKLFYSGIQPTGQLHLGNYFGAVRPWIRLQERIDAQRAVQPVEQGTRDQLIVSVVDLHGLTAGMARRPRYQDVRQMAASLLAAGIEPSTTILYPQSLVSQHSQFFWFLSCVTPLGWLQRMTQFKDKSTQQKSSNLGLLAYPVLQAADILLFKATHVPVGEDQLQHLELAADIARAWNRAIRQRDDGTDVDGDADDDDDDANLPPAPWRLPVPAPWTESSVPRLRSLRDPSAKMSKSAPNDQSRINLADSPDVIAKKMRRAVTDSETGIRYDRQNRPGVSNLIDIYCAVHQADSAKRNGLAAHATGDSTDAVIDDSARTALIEPFARWPTGKFKDAVADALIEHLAPFRHNYASFMQNPDAIDASMERGADRAREIAASNFAHYERALFK